MDFLIMIAVGLVCALTGHYFINGLVRGQEKEKK